MCQKARMCACIYMHVCEFIRLCVYLCAFQHLHTNVLISNSDELEAQGITEEFAIFNVATSRISYVGKVMKKTNEIEALTKARAPYFPTPP